MLTVHVVVGVNINDAVANDRILRALQGLSDHLETSLVKKIVDKGKVATGRGVKSVRVEVQQQIDSIVITESHEDYMTFVALGRKKGGKKVPISAIEQWLKVRNFSWAAGNIRGAAFSVQTNIFKFGIKPTHWISETLSDQENRIFTDVSDAVLNQVDITIDNILREAQKNLTTI